MAVRAVPLGVIGFERRAQAQSLLWRGIATAERIVSALSLPLVLPLLVGAAIATALLSGQSPLIAHRRLGQSGKTIWVLKLRTMWDRTSRASTRIRLVEQLTPEATVPATVKGAGDPRVTSRFARMCRRYSIDELPQLWNVVRGEVAWVGPRPLTEGEVREYYGSAADQLLSVRPGLSGLWQINGRSQLSYPQRRRLDLFLVQHWSLPLYAKILMRTIPTVLLGRHAW